MYRVSILYGIPTDKQAFDDYYRRVHIPIARKMRGLQRWTLTWTDDQEGPLGDVYLTADLYATSKKDMDAILASQEGQEAAQDVNNFATGGVTFVFGAEEEVSVS